MTLHEIWDLAFGKPDQTTRTLIIPSQKSAAADKINGEAPARNSRAEAIRCDAEKTLALMEETLRN